jgi:hypothetical protein
MMMLPIVVAVVSVDDVEPIVVVAFCCHYYSSYLFCYSVCSVDIVFVVVVLTVTH